MTGRRVVLVAAVADNGVIGRDGSVPWRIPEDMRHFRETTTGNSVVMGRVTWDSIGRPLPGRTNIVVTRNRDWHADGALAVPSVEEAVELAHRHPGDVMVIGGAQVYAAAMPLATDLVVTEVHQSPVGDTWFPDVDPTWWRETRREPREGFDLVWRERLGGGAH